MRTGFLAALAALMLAPPAWADSITVSSKNRRGLFENQLKVLDGRAASQYAGSSRLQPKPVAIPEGRVAVARYAGRYDGPYLGVARAAARRHGVPEDLFLRLVHQESGWNERAVSHKGAIGLAQLMPETARLLSVDPGVPQENLDGGARYLRAQYDRFRSWRLALAAYNAGPGAVLQHKGVPPYAETMNYVRVILGD